jgi:hypothetical protein
MGQLTLPYFPEKRLSRFEYSAAQSSMLAGAGGDNSIRQFLNNAASAAEKL